MVRILDAGDQALVVEWAEHIDETVNTQVVRLAADLAASPIEGITETVPTYRSLLVCYDPEIIRGRILGERLLERAGRLDEAPLESRLWRVPVFYGGPACLDLDELAEMKGMSPADIVELHSSAEYRIYMIGFAPGFAYLGGLPEVLHTPRLQTPRQYIAASSIGIGGKQASINSVPGPSGWRYLGRTPVRPFDPQRAEPFLFRAGDRVRFFPISEREAEEYDRRVAAGESIVEPVSV